MPTKTTGNALHYTPFISSGTNQTAITSATAFTNFEPGTNGVNARFARVEARDAALLVRIGTYDGTTYNWGNYASQGVAGCIFVAGGSAETFQLPTRPSGSLQRGAIGLAAYSSSSNAMVHWG
jgi:hypothetical protein